ncbi:MAG: RNA 2',3'-cyclic phosphodiesterase [Gemmatimonadetes bacterium]|nr:RNA 2',3'-cyclic phosphodiesterase [Gemmatimonadota bacterium]
MRLFIAVNFPDELRRGIWTASAPLRAAGLPVRWVEETALHLTLKFLGPTDPGRIADIKAALEVATRETRPFTLPFDGFGAFPSVERPRVIWVGCEGIPPLELMQHRLELEMERLGFEIEGRAFHPHLTLGRVQRDARAARLRQLPALLEGLDYEAESLVDSVELMESTQGRQGSEYRAVYSVALGNRQ